MAIRTKFGETLMNDSLRIDQDCLFDGDIIKVWAKIEDQSDEKQYWISDLVSDGKREVRDVINANLKKRKNAN